ncbi:MAG: hemerythrin domain-containing protein [Proteobacteria bacterium]|nr:hemerythrin domain-containing protein [Pseudomonadota bacterium]
MFESLTASKDDAINILKADHDKVKDIFDKFENASTLSEKKRLAAQAIYELKIHAEIEEKIFYLTVRKELENKIMNEADEEHHVAKLLIAELENIPANDDHWEAKFIVLAENIRHHIKEEEGKMLPKARSLDVDFEALGQSMLAMKSELKKNGIPPSDEARMIKKTRLVDSPAKAARKGKSKAKKARGNGTGKAHVYSQTKSKAPKENRKHSHA